LRDNWPGGNLRIAPQFRPAIGDYCDKTTACGLLENRERTQKMR
jgi:hypothetical protein